MHVHQQKLRPFRILQSFPFLVQQLLHERFSHRGLSIYLQMQPCPLNHLGLFLDAQESLSSHFEPNQMLCESQKQLHLQLRQVMLVCQLRLVLLSLTNQIEETLAELVGHRKCARVLHPLRFCLHRLIELRCEKQPLQCVFPHEFGESRVCLPRP